MTSNSPPTFQLRPYQVEAIAAIQADWRAHSDVLLALPTGLGKTEVFIALLQQVVQPGQRALILAHRDELIQQPHERLLRRWPGVQAGIVKADQNEAAAPVVVASVQTLSRARRRQALLRHGPIDYLIIDEAHHAVADSYRRVLGDLRQANPRLRHLGVTATPMRLDGVGLDAVYQSIAYQRNIRWGVDAGYLAPLVGLSIRTQINLDGVNVRGGDYAEGELTAAVNVLNRNELIVHAYQRFAAGRSALAFGTSVDHAQDLATAFRAAGVSAAMVCGATPLEERRATLGALRDGGISVVCNYQVLTEGFDAPMVSCILMARPTLSQGLYIQMVGRGTRLYPGKRDCQVLDFVDSQHQMVITLEDLLGKPLAQRDAEESAREQGIILPGYGDEVVDYDPYDIQVEGIGLYTATLDLLADSRLSWFMLGRAASLALGDAGGTLFILPPLRERDRALILERLARGQTYAQEGRYARQVEFLAQCAARPADYVLLRCAGKPVVVEPLARSASFEELLGQAEALAQREGAAPIRERYRDWRGQEPTPAQARLLHSLDPGGRASGVTRGQASQIITHRLAQQTIRRAFGPLAAEEA
ncbi:MAG: DEAD/DEAH box helicase [Chloroflexi bacterium]|nr:DEAD/DEAH box helicase [Chloroflexota bacterium]